jgi:hypothetical protein
MRTNWKHSGLGPTCSTGTLCIYHGADGRRHPEGGGSIEEFDSDARRITPSIEGLPIGSAGFRSLVALNGASFHIWIPDAPNFVNAAFKKHFKDARTADPDDYYVPNGTLFSITYRVPPKIAE